MVSTELDISNMLPAKLTAPGLTEEEFIALCRKFPDALVEYYAADGTLTIMPPTDFNSSSRETEVVTQLAVWSKKHGGKMAGSSAGFRLSDGSRLSPDAVWCDAKRWEAAQRKGTRYPPFAPDFIIEVRSPDARLSDLKDKMQVYMDNGVQLGWLIDPKQRQVYIYRPGSGPEILNGPTEVHGEGPVDGFVLNLEEVFD